MIEKKLTRSEQKRLAILEAAKQAFQENGVQGTSMDKLAALAQVSKRTVYNHFATKEELVIHLTTSLWRQAMQDIDVVYCPDTPLQEQLQKLVEAEIEVMCSREYIDLTRVAFGHYFYHPEALHKEVEKMAEQETTLARWLKAASKDKRLKTLDIQQASTELHSLFKGSCFWPQMLKMAPVPSKSEQKAIAEKSVAMFLSYYAA